MKGKENVTNFETLLEGMNQDMEFTPIEFEVSGPYALFTTPHSKISGNKESYQVPPYEALRGIMESIYWKPTIRWVIDAVRVMNPIRYERRPVLGVRFNSPKHSQYNYLYLKDVRYQVRAHFEFNKNQTEMIWDRNAGKHDAIARRSIMIGGRRDLYFGCRECVADVTPCVFGDGEGAYDAVPEKDFGFMYHGMTYADDAVLEDDKDHLTANFWSPVMKYGVIQFARPERCKQRVKIHEMKPVLFTNLVGFTDHSETGVERFDLAKFEKASGYHLSSGLDEFDESMFENPKQEWERMVMMESIAQNRSKHHRNRNQRREPAYV